MLWERGLHENDIDNHMIIHYDTSRLYLNENNILKMIYLVTTPKSGLMC